MYSLQLIFPSGLSQPIPTIVPLQRMNTRNTRDLAPCAISGYIKEYGTCTVRFNVSRYKAY